VWCDTAVQKKRRNLKFAPLYVTMLRYIGQNSRVGEVA